MTTSTESMDSPRVSSSFSATDLLPVLLAIGVFVNASLLFAAEPMFSKLLLPLLGGTPTVWNTCLVFFQAALLCGYAYAHFATRALGPRMHPPVHIALLALSCVVLPLQLRLHGEPPSGGLGVLWIFGLLIISLGAPFVMLASGALVAQRWLADTDHPHSANPYFLYAASNSGSLIALLAYPLFIEPRLSLSTQRIAWSAGYLLHAAVVATSAWVFLRSPLNTRRNASVASLSESNVRAGDRARWVLYAAVPSMLLVAVTTHLSTDIAAVPLLWILPLATYLLTFVLVFANRQVFPPSWMLRIEAYVLMVIALPIFWGYPVPALPGILLQLGLLFVVSMVCHAELVRTKPPPVHLTEFFVWLSVGGLVGGVFAALIAPLVFDSVLEYPIALTLAAFLRPRHEGQPRARRVDLTLGVLAGAAAIIARQYLGTPGAVPFVVITSLLGIALFSLRNRTLGFAAVLSSLLVAGYAGIGENETNLLYRKRSFFGVYQVEDAWGGTVRMLLHGTTLHGAQSLNPGRRLVPLSYYHPSGPAGDIFKLTKAGRLPNRRVAVVGLGTGALACYGNAGERWTFYEIDPLVASIARDTTLFTFLRDCGPSVDIVLGDARLKLGHTSSGQYDMLVLDAFSSDAIPVHLLTREAVREYVRVTVPGGLIALHISNRHIDLEPAVAEVARDAGLVSMLRIGSGGPRGSTEGGVYPSDWVVLARNTEDLGDVANDSQWRQLRGKRHVHVWTDDYSNILRVLKWRWRR
jgi:spermidine synthase